MKNVYLLPFIFSFLSLFFFFGCASGNQTTVSTTKNYSPFQLKQDLDFLVKTDEQVHPNLFVHTQKFIFDSIVASVRNRINKPMTAFEFYKLIAPAVSSLKDGHTLVGFPYKFREKYLNSGGKIIPFDIYVKNNKIFVSKNYSPDSMLAPNSEIVSINSIKASGILKTLCSYTFGEFKSFRYFQIQRMFKPFIWTCFGFKGPFNIKYISSVNKRCYTKLLIGATVTQIKSLLQNDTIKYHKWTFGLLDKNKIALIDMNSFGSPKDLDSYKRFLDSSFTEIKQKRIHNLIIDVRGNEGGETKLVEALINYIANKPWTLFSRADWKLSKQAKSDLIPWYLRWIPIKPFLHFFSFMYTSASIKKIEYDSVDSQLLHVYMEPGKLKANPLRFKGHVYVLIDNGSFSASVIFAAVMKDYGFATLIGEETGQSANPFGGLYIYKLPNTHLTAGVPTGRSFRPSGLITGRGVIPDYIVKQNYNDLRNDRDTVLDFTKNLITRNLKIKIAR